MIHVRKGKALELLKFRFAQFSPEALPGEVRAYALANDLDPVDMAFTGGEDYALLGCCRPAMFDAVPAAVSGLIPLGLVTADGVVLVNGDLPASVGFDHFSG